MQRKDLNIEILALLHTVGTGTMYVKPYTEGVEVTL